VSGSTRRGEEPLADHCLHVSVSPFLPSFQSAGWNALTPQFNRNGDLERCELASMLFRSILRP
jgi:hypothetical protein